MGEGECCTIWLPCGPKKTGIMILLRKIRHFLNRWEALIIKYDVVVYDGEEGGSLCILFSIALLSFIPHTKAEKGGAESKERNIYILFIDFVVVIIIIIIYFFSS